MQTGMRFSTDKSHTDETEDMFGIAVVANGTTQNCTGVGDLVVIDVLGRIAIGETFESKTGQKVERFAVLKQRATSSNLDHLNKYKIKSNYQFKKSDQMTKIDRKMSKIS